MMKRSVQKLISLLMVMCMALGVCTGAMAQTADFEALVPLMDLVAAASWYSPNAPEGVPGAEDELSLSFVDAFFSVGQSTGAEVGVTEAMLTDTAAQAELLANTIAEVLPGRIAGIVDGAAASVVDYAVKPASPSWPSKSTHAMLGFILGFVGIVTIILLRAMLDTTMRTEDDLMAAYPYPVLSAIPDLMERNKKKSSYYYYNYSHYGYYQHDGKDESTERG